jgi:UDP-glucose 4-epimerase
MSRASVLVTGGAGFIGSHVCERFAAGGFDVRVLDDLSSGDRANCQPSWTLLEDDVRDAAAVERAVAGAEVVVHLAAFTSVPESFERFEDCYRTNVRGTFNVLEACARHGVAKLVFASSSAVYAELPDAPKREADCPEPISPYGISKLEGEHLLELYRESRGLASAALRFFNVYGPRQPADSAYAAAVPIFMERGLAGKSITIYGDGHQTRDFVYVADVAEAVFRAGRGGATGVFNVGTGRPIQVVELADVIAGLAGSDAEHQFEDRRAGDVRSSTADVGRAAAALDWSPAHGLEQGLAQTLAWYRQRAASR